MRILVIGANGFLGSHTCRALQRHGHSPIAAFRATADLWRLDRLAANVEKVTLDVTDRNSVSRAIAQIEQLDGVVNCTGYGVNYSEQDAVIAYSVNVAAAMTIAIASHARGIQMVHIGTSYEYGDWPGHISEDCPLMPSGIYGKTKAAATLSLTAFAETINARITILRMFSLYGPLEGGHKLIPAVLRAKKNKRQLDMTPGDQIRDYLYVQDAADAIYRCLVQMPVSPGQTINICSGHPVTLKDFVGLAVGDSTSVAWAVKPYRQGEMMRVVGNPSRAASMLNWKPTTTIALGMAQTQQSEALRPAGH